MVEVLASALDGSEVGDTLSMTITPPEVPVTGITISSTGGVTEVDEGSTLQFTASVTPVNATNPSVSWSVHQGTGSAVISQSGLLTAGTAGTIDVRATALDGSGISSNFSLTINGPDGLPKEEEDKSILLYPNPSPGKFYLNAGAISLDKVQVFSL